MAIRVGINGFGRTGRLAYRAALEKGLELDIVAMNRGDARTMAHLLRHDSVHGPPPFNVEVEGDIIFADGRELRVLYESDPAKLPWEDLGVELVIEASGRFRGREEASKHLAAGAGKVLIAAPAKNPDLTVVMGVNDHLYDPRKHHIVSNASCTTNCIAPVVKILHDRFGVESGFMTTVHAYTNTQTLLDRAHRDLRRARSAGTNIIPTSTGAAAAIGQVIPELDGRLDGMAFRVPVSNVSILDFIGVLETETTVEEVNGAFRQASEGELEGILGYTEEPLVSSDYIHNPQSAVVDGPLTMAKGRQVKVMAWYDNEWGYSCRLAEMAEKMGRLAGR
ncbi:MAG: type I glyceraldehyde-3-phosphate dehydrogenase [Candidatus Bathyarchaeota archaeon]|nr:MAG: type I glyceraldehyde-3-phosphate dehydrogenase [Candidatus Bathyarchaeota archaeon]